MSLHEKRSDEVVADDLRTFAHGIENQDIPFGSVYRSSLLLNAADRLHPEPPVTIELAANTYVWSVNDGRWHYGRRSGDGDEDSRASLEMNDALNEISTLRRYVK